MRSLLSNITQSDIDLDPFPHVFVRDVLDEETHRALNDGFPSFATITGADPRFSPRSNRRYQLSSWPILIHPDMSEAWKAFVAHHASPAFYAEVVALFRDHWPNALREALGGDLMGHPMGLMLRDDFKKARILQDARAEINTPVLDKPSSSRGAHLDMPNRIFSCLYYLRHPDDDAVGGELELFRWKNGPVPNINVYELPPDAVEVVKTIPYRANQMVIFPQSIDAVHGVGIRHSTPHIRRYVFITAEIADSWLVSPAAPAPGRPTFA
ncbi:2OG-Fe(II) oxygenase [Azospirillum sp. SYSU D00513]|uniref:2OG-Fe(II) oxygenase n=1 Tax=Azospirillum sp. SYSU D00513 TaxID=2812561 RepID=UPI001A95B273|nr:2OG-Fe(II) oxygenase [Azospirillum sp. SYSU D00513]